MLILSRRVNERIIIGDSIELSVVEIRGDQVKIGIDAPRDVKVYRQEVFEAIQEENRAAARTGIKLPTLEDMIPKEKEGPEPQPEPGPESDDHRSS